MLRWTFVVVLLAACVPGDRHAIGGAVTGLTGTGLVLQLNGTGDIALTANATTFQFTTWHARGASYAVTVLAQPTDPAQTCAVTNGTGIVGDADVSDVSVTCAANCEGITCPAAADRCHVAGICDPSTGECLAQMAAQCPTGETCSLLDGSCQPVNLCAGVTCAATDRCHVPGVCAPSTGVCSTPTEVQCPSGQTCSLADGTCQPVIAPGAKLIFFDDFSGTTLSSDWTVISRHGMYAQAETECNVPEAVTLANGSLDIQTTAQSATCGDFNVDGTVRHAPASWPYVTGAVQWKNLSFTYGTVTIRARFPGQSTRTWPALWLLGSNCQNTNPLTADVGYDTCPDGSSPSYAEIDMVECDLNNWCQLALSTLKGFPTCGFQQDPMDTSYHVFSLTWTASEISVSMDGVPTGCSFASPQWDIPSTPMFLIMQTQTGGAGGVPEDSALPATFSIDYVLVTQP